MSNLRLADYTEPLKGKTIARCNWHNEPDEDYPLLLVVLEGLLLLESFFIVDGITLLPSKNSQQNHVVVALGVLFPRTIPDLHLLQRPKWRFNPTLRLSHE